VTQKRHHSTPISPALSTTIRISGGFIQIASVFGALESFAGNRNSSPSKHVDASATYILVQGNGDALSIVFQIDHQDLASVIKEQQNAQQ
jgi:hypothetical protein